MRGLPEGPGGVRGHGDRGGRSVTSSPLPPVPPGDNIPVNPFSFDSETLHVRGGTRHPPRTQRPSTGVRGGTVVICPPPSRLTCVRAYAYGRGRVHGCVHAGLRHVRAGASVRVGVRAHGGPLRARGDTTGHGRYVGACRGVRWRTEGGTVAVDTSPPGPDMIPGRGEGEWAGGSARGDMSGGGATAPEGVGSDTDGGPSRRWSERGLGRVRRGGADRTYKKSVADVAGFCYCYHI